MSSDEIIVDTGDAPDTGMQGGGVAPPPSGPLNAPSDESAPDTPDAPDTGTQAAPGGIVTPGLLEYEPLAEYLISYIGQLQFRVGANGPFLFAVFRMDQGIVAYPTINACNIVAPDGSIATADLANPSAPADPTKPIVAAGSEPGATLQVYVLYDLTQIGTYEIDLELAWGSVIASTPAAVTIICNP